MSVKQVNETRGSDFVTNLHNFDIRQAFQKGFQIDAIQHNAIVKNVAV